jgi:nucleoside-diphosphate-sugar epimerase
MQKGTVGRRYILSSERLLYKEMFNTIARLLGGPPVQRTLPAVLRTPLALMASAASALVPGLPVSSHVIKFTFGFRYFSAARAASELGWQPRVSFEDAIRAASEFDATG